jgi:hypothetical protein
LPPDAAQEAKAAPTPEQEAALEAAQVVEDQELLADLINNQGDLWDRFSESVYNTAAGETTFGDAAAAQQLVVNIQQEYDAAYADYIANVRHPDFRRKLKTPEAVLDSFIRRAIEIVKQAHIVDGIPGASKDRRAATRKLNDIMLDAIAGNVVPAPGAQAVPDANNPDSDSSLGSQQPSVDSGSLPPPPPPLPPLPDIPDGPVQFKPNLPAQGFLTIKASSDQTSYFVLLKNLNAALNLGQPYFTDDYVANPGQAQPNKNDRKSFESAILKGVREATTKAVNIKQNEIKLDIIRATLMADAVEANRYIRADPTREGVANYVTKKLLASAPRAAASQAGDAPQGGPFAGPDAAAAATTPPRRRSSAARSKSRSRTSSDAKDPEDSQATQGPEPAQAGALEGSGRRKRKAAHVAPRGLKGYGMEADMPPPPPPVKQPYVPSRQAMAILGQQDLPIYDRANPPNFSVSDSNMYTRRAFYPNHQQLGSLQIKHGVQIGDVDDPDTRFNAKRRVRPAPGWLRIDDGPASKMARRHF